MVLGARSDNTRTATLAEALLGERGADEQSLRDGTVAYEGLSNTGIYRLYVVNGQRVIRAEARNKATGALSWAEPTEAK